MAALLEQGRLKLEDVPDGLIPGEAAAFVVLESGANRRRGGVSVGETAIAEEETVRAGESNRGAALTRVLRQTGGTLPDFPRVVGDLNGERLRHIEWALGCIRGLGRVKARAGGPTETEIWHPADCVGDTGAASGILNFVWAATALEKGYALTDQALVWGASDGVLRGAAVLKLAER